MPLSRRLPVDARLPDLLECQSARLLEQLTCGLATACREGACSRALLCPPPFPRRPSPARPAQWSPSPQAALSDAARSTQPSSGPVHVLAPPARPSLCALIFLLVDEQGAPSPAQASFPSASCTLRHHQRSAQSPPFDARQPTPTPTPPFAASASTLAATLCACTRRSPLCTAALSPGLPRQKHSRPPISSPSATPIPALRRCLAAGATPAARSLATTRWA